jgi:hypothetical protein
MTERVGDWMQTFTGRQFWPADPRPEDVTIHDIAHALSMQCRYAGHCTRFYSVAEHSVLVARSVPPEHRMWGLLHDASEAYLVDVPRPIKPYLTGYADLETGVMRAICERYGLPPEMPKAVKDIDNRILVDEKQALMLPGPRWGSLDGLSRVGVTIVGMPPADAEKLFLQAFMEFS